MSPLNRLDFARVKNPDVFCFVVTRSPAAYSFPAADSNMNVVQMRVA